MNKLRINKPIEADWNHEGNSPNLHQRWEEISMHAIGKETCFVCSTGHRYCQFNSLLLNLDCRENQNDPSRELLNNNEGSHTARSIAYGTVYDGYKFRDNMVDFIEPSQDGDDIGTWIGIFLNQDTT